MGSSTGGRFTVISGRPGRSRASPLGVRNPVARSSSTRDPSRFDRRILPLLWSDQAPSVQYIFPSGITRTRLPVLLGLVRSSSTRDPSRLARRILSEIQSAQYILPPAKSSASPHGPCSPVVMRSSTVAGIYPTSATRNSTVQGRGSVGESAAWEQHPASPRLRIDGSLGTGPWRPRHLWNE